MDGKSLIESRTMWVNLIAIAAMLAQGRFGFVIEPDYQAGILSVINLILRLVTKKPIVWNNDASAMSDVTATSKEGNR
jgi:hypothetical protein